MIVEGIRQTTEGPLRLLRGKVALETSEARLEADELDYNEQTGEAEVRGNVRYKNFNGGEEIRCNRAVYNTQSETGKFYEVSGIVPATIQTRPGVLTSTNPFVFEGRWAEKIENRYVLHHGFVTSCKIPKPGPALRVGRFAVPLTSPRPWWVLRGPKFDIVPGERVVTRGTRFALRGLPIFYFPYFYKSLEKQPRRSGFLMPNIGNSSRRGLMTGLGYYWAINRSLDVSYRVQYFSLRGFAHLADFRGKPTQRSDFNVILFGVNDKGLLLADGSRRKASGVSIVSTLKAGLPKGWELFGQVNYLSSFRFRQEFTETFNEAVFSEVNSTLYAHKHWNGYSAFALYQQTENFQSILEGDKISVRKLPQVEFSSRDRQWGKLPVWLSLNASVGLVSRDQLLFQTRRFVDRIDIAPRVTVPLHWRHVSLVPYVSLRGSHWGSSLLDRPGRFVTGGGINRNAFETGFDLVLPSLSRVFQTSGIFGEKLKHVIEPRASYRYVTGVKDFQRIIRFDETELLNNTNEIEYSLTNRLFSKKGGVTREWLSWQVWQRRYFDPTFGGALVPGQRNVLASTIGVSPYAFLDGPRNYSPIVSVVRTEPLPGFGAEWRADYDPARGGISNSGVSVDGRVSELFISAGHNQVRSASFLTPPANQFRGLVGLGRENRRGWNAGFFAVYDYRLGALQFANTQVTYNTDCCGFSVQYRRFNFGARFENQFRIAIAIANIGSFGTLRRQERYF